MIRFPTAPPADYHVPNKVRSSFAGCMRWCKLTGAGRLVRLVPEIAMTSSRATTEAILKKKPSYWFTESLFLHLHSEAKRELSAQLTGSRSPVASMNSLIGLYMRHCFRQDLAVSKDWTEEFAGYAVLTLRPQDSMLAMVGPIRDQPYYSQSDPRHAFAESKDTRLPGGAEQIVIDFNLAENASLLRQIEKPSRF